MLRKIWSFRSLGTVQNCLSVERRGQEYINLRKPAFLIYGRTVPAASAGECISETEDLSQRRWMPVKGRSRGESPGGSRRPSSVSLGWAPTQAAPQRCYPHRSARSGARPQQPPAAETAAAGRSPCGASPPPFPRAVDLARGLAVSRSSDAAQPRGRGDHGHVGCGWGDLRPLVGRPPLSPPPHPKRGRGVRRGGGGRVEGTTRAAAPPSERPRRHDVAAGAGGGGEGKRPTRPHAAAACCLAPRAAGGGGGRNPGRPLLCLCPPPSAAVLWRAGRVWRWQPAAATSSAALSRARTRALAPSRIAPSLAVKPAVPGGALRPTCPPSLLPSAPPPATARRPLPLRIAVRV